MSTELDELLDETEQFRSEGEHEFLRENEQKELQALEQKVRRLQTKVGSVATYLDNINHFETKREKLADQSAPYLEFDSYLEPAEKQDLFDAIERVRAAIVQCRDEIDSDLVSVAERERLARVENRVNQLEKHLTGYNQSFAERTFLPIHQSVSESVLAIDDELRSARQYGAEIPSSAPAIRTHIEQTIDHLESSFEYPSFEHLTEEKRVHLEDLRSRLVHYEDFLEQKETFDRSCPAAESRLSELEELSKPYQNYESYLTVPGRRELTDAIDAVRGRLQAIETGVDVSVLATQDVSRLESLRITVQDIESHLDGYNDAFVSTERNRHAEFFSGPEGTDTELTQSQQEAVIRNGLYNQVIAAAGTGKTLALIYRVAYLVLKRGVPPSRILVMAFTREAKKELEGRLDSTFGITDVEVTTLHAFGYSVLEETRHQKPTTIDESNVYNLIDTVVREEAARPQSEFYDHYLEFLVRYEDRYLSETDFETKEEYVTARAEQTYTTLKGETVKSRAEKEISDWLFLHQVDYQYERLAPWAETDPEKTAYTPDFYLPEHGVYIEHFGIDESGEIAPWFSQSTEEYLDGIRWKRQQFSDAKYELVETYEFETEAERIPRALEARLRHHGVELDRLTYDELFEAVYEYAEKEEWIHGQFREFIENAKRFQLDAATIQERLDRSNPRQFHFGQCGLFLLRRYQQYLLEHSLIDYEDMIQDAVETIRRSPDRFQDRYDHVLVDEFQDVVPTQIALVRLLAGADGANLFCVGDDWQSIFGFRGASIEYFIDFAENVGPPTRTELITNFRSPRSVIEAGNCLISNNERQYEKEVTSRQEKDLRPLLHTLDGTSSARYLDRLATYTVSRIEFFLSRGAAPGDIMVLCRFDNAVRYLDEIKRRLREQGIPYDGDSDDYRPTEEKYDSGISVYSVHQSKGREADHVILIHAVEGPYGFPREDGEDELLEPVRDTDFDPIEEERRMWYVAMTRTKQSLDIITREGRESRFIDEIGPFVDSANPNTSLASLENIGDEVTLTARVAHLYEDTHEKIQQRGILEDGTGSMLFVAWENNDSEWLNEDSWYQFQDIEVSEYEDKIELMLTENTMVTMCDGPDTTSSVGPNAEPGELQPQETSKSHSNEAKSPAAPKKGLSDTDARSVIIRMPATANLKISSVKEALLGDSVATDQWKVIDGSEIGIGRTRPPTDFGSNPQKVTITEQTRLTSSINAQNER